MSQVPAKVLLAHELPSYIIPNSAEIPIEAWWALLSRYPNLRCSGIVQILTRDKKDNISIASDCAIVGTAYPTKLKPATRIHLKTANANFLLVEKAARSALLGQVVMTGMQASVIVEKLENLLIVEVDPCSSADEPVIFTENTKIVMKLNAASRPTVPKQLMVLAGAGGIAYQELRSIFNYFLTSRRVGSSIGLPMGFLLAGPPGVGKTHMVRCLCSDLNIDMVAINGPELVSAYVGEAEENLRKVFSDAQIRADGCATGLGLVFIDEIDSIAEKRSSSSSQSQRRMVTQLLTLLDGSRQRSNLFVIGATNRPNVIDPAMRRPGRFDREYVIDPPDAEARKQILKELLHRLPGADDSTLSNLAQKTIGFVAADLTALAREIIINSVEGSSWALSVEQAMATSQPSLMREHRVPVDPSLSWDDIGGLAEIKEKLIQSVEWPLKHKDIYVRLGLNAPKGILLYGPPGCSKTTIAKILANTGGFNFYSLSGASLYSCLVGESERLVRNIFANARMTLPAIIFIDEIDAIVGKRGTGASDVVQERILSTFLNEMDGIESLKQGATNRKDAIDEALLRPGRFDELIEIPLPNRQDRADILRTLARKSQFCNEIVFDDIAERTEGYSGADLKGLVQKAALNALREDRLRIMPSDILDALSRGG